MLNTTILTVENIHLVYVLKTTENGIKASPDVQIQNCILYTDTSNSNTFKNLL